MPSQPLNDNPTSSGSTPAGPGRLHVGSVEREMVVRPVRVIAFWTAIALPFLHIPLLLRGLEATPELYAFFGLITLNFVALVIGHGHNGS